MDSDLNFVDFAISYKTRANETLADEILTDETTRLLWELDRAIDHSSVLRNIIRRQEALQEIESITGSSHRTRTLRQEIASLEFHH